MNSQRRTTNAGIELQPLDPDEAEELWRDSHRDEFAEATLQLQGHHISEFVGWLHEQDIGDMRDVTARTVHRFRLDITDDLAATTLSQRIGTVQRFLRFCTSLDGVAPSVPERIDVPSRSGKARDERLGEEQAEAALTYLRRFSYASREHALLALCWHTGLRTGTIRALDVSDVQAEHDRLRIRHRPQMDTPLKNKSEAERYVALSPDVTAVLEDYVEYSRPSSTDEYGREPLFATEHGRAQINTLRRWFEVATRPCNWGECPHERDPATCEAADTVRFAKDCPSTRSGHPIRRGAITRLLREDVPDKVVSDRCNVSNDVLDEHYDRRTEDEKMEQRREYLNGN